MSGLMYSHDFLNGIYLDGARAATFLRTKRLYIVKQKQTPRVTRLRETSAAHSENYLYREQKKGNIENKKDTVLFLNWALLALNLLQTLDRFFFNYSVY